MDTINALIMGIIQGLSEYLPISSSGHLEICRQILGMDLPGDEALQFSILLHVATVLSTIVVLWKEFMPLCKAFFTFRKGPEFNYVIKILISCIPVAIVGICFKDLVEHFFGNGLFTVGICLCVTAVLLSFTYFYRTDPRTAVCKHNGTISQGRDITYIDAFVIGIAQAIAVLPGLSRSGSTIATGILIGDKRSEMAKFSFFMVIIPILGEALLDAKKIFEAPAADASMEWMPMLAGFLAAFVVGCAACRWMINIVKKGKLVWFAVYCLIVGIICMIFQ
ncbi:MAG: undecaprenyl-diphosphate phosphatase [Muribaculaceae bacterium]|nr:undecaprenyl-diphosphate phosphatase [Muribaculaceae bacterium]